jgi:xanthine dehydrogenase accessory factor
LNRIPGLGHNDGMAMDIFEEIVRLRRSGLKAALATIVARRGSTPRKDAAKMIILEDGSLIGSIGGGCTEADVCREAANVIRLEKSILISFDLTEDDAEDSGLLCGGTMEVYLEPILPDPVLYIFGAGHIGQCVAALVRSLSFKVAVVDDRIKYANRERFPAVDEIYVDEWQEVFARLPVNPMSYILIATRGHRYDLSCLRFALSTNARYIGLLGSRRKTKLLYEALAKEGMDSRDFERVYAPVGLEIGSETPEEIAVSIAAELVAVKKNLDIQPLKKAIRFLKPAVAES